LFYPFQSFSFACDCCGGWSFNIQQLISQFVIPSTFGSFWERGAAESAVGGDDRSGDVLSRLFEFCLDWSGGLDNATAGGRCADEIEHQCGTIGVAGLGEAVELVFGHGVSSA
jgi:hypothetical protein